MRSFSHVVQVTFDATALREQGLSDQEIMDLVGRMAREEARRRLTGEAE